MFRFRADEDSDVFTSVMCHVFLLKQQLVDPWLDLIIPIESVRIDLRSII